MPVHWVSDNAQLQQFLARPVDGRAWAIDTEFMREQTYFPQFALLQLSDGESIWLLDPLSLDLSLLRACLDRVDRYLIYAASEDISVFLHALQWRPKELIDVQIALAFLGAGASLSLRDALKLRLGIDLDKSETRSNWLHRPLNDQQQRYAAADVAHLHQLWEPIATELHRRELLPWFHDECRRCSERVSLALEAQPHWNVRSHRELTEDAQRRLYRLLHWRDASARESNRPRNWIAPPALLLMLAERAPSDASQVLALLRRLELPGSERRAQSLLAALQTPRPEDSAFVAAPAPLDRTQRARGAELKAWLETRAAALAMPVELLAPRRLQEHLARDGKRWPEEFLGWRQQALSEITAVASAIPRTQDNPASGTSSPTSGGSSRA